MSEEDCKSQRLLTSDTWIPVLSTEAATMQIHPLFWMFIAKFHLPFPFILSERSCLLDFGHVRDIGNVELQDCGDAAWEERPCDPNRNSVWRLFSFALPQLSQCPGSWGLITLNSRKRTNTSGNSNVNNKDTFCGQ